MNRYQLFIVLLLASLLAGCGHTPAQRQRLQQDIVNSSLNNSHSADEPPALTAVPDEIASLLQPSLSLPTTGYGDSEQAKISQQLASEARFDIKVLEMEATPFFMALIEDTRYNLIIDPTVSGTISLDLKNVTVPQVLELVRNLHGYDFEIRGDSLQIFANTPQTRIFKLNYLEAKRTGISTTSAGSSAGANNNANANSDQNGTTTITTEKKEDQLWDNLKSTVEMIVQGDNTPAVASAAPAVSVIVNPQTGIIVVKALPLTLRKVADFLQQSQEMLVRQVIIEARILEVELSESYQSGINWTSLRDYNGTQALFTQTGGGSINSGSGVTMNAGVEGNIVEAGATGNLATNTSAFGGVFSLALKDYSFAAFIELLKTQGDVHVLSNPRVSTLNNQKAVIKVGTDEFFVNGVSTSTTDGVVTAIPELGSFFSGVALDVTPQIDNNGEITLHIHPTVSEVTNQNKNIGNFTFPLASSNIREADSVVRVRSGQIIVIGGLMQNRTRDSEGKVPLLGDMPLIGPLFTHTAQQQVKSELVILLKPQVISASGDEWQQQLGETAGKLSPDYRRD
ncbi:MAG: pilus (MSHA type) biogenesis protein MshL [Gammaproteobacteria bacterium]|nr:pilus (MSHA type) biogenesis protein MshL [Gammaproteobacteria bacterium]